ncbi:MAG: ABC transporter ATP-binding protein [Burkholderiaceae bacterium]|nr:ABC transporter ATP-binding protein [Burkholderiaceae bacterium]
MAAQSAPPHRAATRDVVLRTQDLRAGYGRVPVLHGIDLAVREDEIVGVLGHNGMGKSTLIRTLMGLLPVSAGRLEINGIDVTREPAHLRARVGVGYVPQGRGILPALSVEENLRLAWLRNGQESEAQALARVLALFPRVERLLDRRGGFLSGGEQQLLALARALMTDPWLLVLDEPTEGIQPSIIEEMAATLVRLRDEHGLTLLVVEQNLDFILDCADRVLVLEKGAIQAEVSGEQLRDPARLAGFVGLGAARVTRGGASAIAGSPTAPVSANPRAGPVRAGASCAVAAPVCAAPAYRPAAPLPAPFLRPAHPRPPPSSTRQDTS